MGKLDGKVALITGSGLGNIGRATQPLKLAGEGAHIVVNARGNEAEAEAVAREVRRKRSRRWPSSPTSPRKNKSMRWRRAPCLSSAASTF